MHKQLTEAWRRRPRLIVGSAVGAIALVGLGAFALGGGKAEAPPEAGPVMDIAVVAPKEPEIQPGERMEVGALVDDFDASAIRAPTPVEVAPESDYYAEQPAYTDDAPPPRIRRYASQGPAPDEWRMVDGRGDRLGLGFDGPRPESGAEREARRPAASSANPVRQYSSRPSGDPNATFY